MVRSRVDSVTYPVFADCVPETEIKSGRYTVRFARNAEELDRLQKLRFDVFNVEMGEGLDESFEDRRDRDRFDAHCHHLIVLDNKIDEVIGTYRMQTSAMAEHHGGFYSADEFRLEMIPGEVLNNAIEVGRACVARRYRNRHVLFLLWRGLAAYLETNSKRYLFGCCSLTSQDRAEGRRVMAFLESQDYVQKAYEVLPQPNWVCYEGPSATADPAVAKVKLPKLFQIYMRYGAKICGPPALDRFFKTIDYLVVLDTDDLDAESRRTFFG